MSQPNSKKQGISQQQQQQNLAQQQMQLQQQDKSSHPSQNQVANSIQNQSGHNNNPKTVGQKNNFLGQQNLIPTDPQQQHINPQKINQKPNTAQHQQHHQHHNPQHGQVQGNKLSRHGKANYQYIIQKELSLEQEIEYEIYLNDNFFPLELMKTLEIILAFKQFISDQEKLYTDEKWIKYWENKTQQYIKKKRFFLVGLYSGKLQAQEILKSYQLQERILQIMTNNLTAYIVQNQNDQFTMKYLNKLKTLTQQTDDTKSKCLQNPQQFYQQQLTLIFGKALKFFGQSPLKLLQELSKRIQMNSNLLKY